MIKTTLFAALLGLVIVGFPAGAAACASEPSPPFREALVNADSVFIFRLESAAIRRENLGDEVIYEYLHGRIRVVETLKGEPATFTSLTLESACGDVRLDVGGFFLAATSQDGQTLKLSASDRSVLDVTLGLRGELPARSSPSPIVRSVLAFIDGKELPDGFPSTEQQARTLKHAATLPCKNRD